MSHTKEIVDGEIRLKVESSLTIYDAPVLLDELLDCFENGGEMTLDLGAVTDCDAAGLQLLYAARKNALGNRQSFRVLGASETILDALHRLGLNPDEII